MAANRTVTKIQNRGGKKTFSAAGKSRQNTTSKNSGEIVLVPIFLANYTHVKKRNRTTGICKMKKIIQLILFASLLALATAQEMQDLYCGDMNCYEGNYLLGKTLKKMTKPAFEFFQFSALPEMQPSQKLVNPTENWLENGIRIVLGLLKTKNQQKRSSCKSRRHMKSSEMTNPGKSTITCWTIPKKCGRIITGITGAEWLPKSMFVSSSPSP